MSPTLHRRHLLALTLAGCLAGRARADEPDSFGPWLQGLRRRGLAPGGRPPPLDPAARPGGAPADEPDPFGPWLEGLRRDVLAQGVRPATLDRALAGLSP